MNKSCKECDFSNGEEIFLVRITVKPGKKFLILDDDLQVVMKLIPPTEALGEFSPETGQVFFRKFAATVSLADIEARWDQEIIDAFLRGPDGSENELFT